MPFCFQSRQTKQGNSALDLNFAIYDVNSPEPSVQHKETPQIAQS